MKEKILKGLKWFFNSFIWIFILGLFLDLLTKNLVVYYAGIDPRLMTYKGLSSATGIDLIPGFLRINYVINQNVAFGGGLGSPLANRIIFIIVALAVTIGLVIYLIKKFDKINKYVKACIMLILVGAVGNAIDRMFYSGEYLHFGYNGVVDWIDFYGIWKFNFNIADSCVVVGAIMLIIYLIVEEIKEYKAKKAKEIKSDKKAKVEKVLSKDEKERLERLNKDK